MELQWHNKIKIIKLEQNHCMLHLLNWNTLNKAFTYTEHVMLPHLKPLMTVGSICTSHDKGKKS